MCGYENLKLKTPAHLHINNCTSNYMANLVEFLVRLKDMASGPLQKLGSTGQNSFAKIQQSMEKVSGRFNSLGMNITQIDAKLESLRKTRQISFDSSQISRINKEIDTLQSKKDRLEGGRSAGGLGSMFRTGLAIAGIGSLAYLGKDIMQAGIGRQMDLTSLQTLVGKNDGNLLNAQLIDFAKKSIYGNEVFNEGKLMAGSGIKAGNIMPVMRMIGDIAMGDKERMKSLALAFSEASTRGSLTGINERMFLQGGLFNPIEQLHKMTKRSLPDLKKDMEKGKISIDMLVKAMEYATGPLGRWHNAMKNLQETPAGKWTAFTGTLRTLAGTIGLALLPALGVLTDFLTGLINNENALWGIGLAIGSITSAWLLYTIGVKAAALWTAALEADILWPIAAAAAIGVAIATICLENDKLADSSDNAKNKFWTLGKAMTTTFQDIAYVAQVMVLGIESTFERFNRVVVAKRPGDVWNALKHLGDDTDADKKITALRNEHTWKRAMFMAGLDEDGKPQKKGASPLDVFGGKYTPAGGADGSVTGSDTASGITGGGVRNITINVAKFQDKTEIHTVGLKEGIQEVEEIIRDMFLRITNSAASAMN